MNDPQREGHMASYIARRKFLATLLGGAAAAWPLAARAQRTTRPIVGLLNSASADKYAYLAAAFRQGLNDLGFVDGQNITIEYRWAAGQYDRLSEMAADWRDPEAFESKINSGLRCCGRELIPPRSVVGRTPQKATDPISAHRQRLIDRNRTLEVVGFHAGDQANIFQRHKLMLGFGRLPEHQIE